MVRAQSEYTKKGRECLECNQNTLPKGTHLYSAVRIHKQYSRMLRVQSEYTMISHECLERSQNTLRKVANV